MVAVDTFERLTTAAAISSSNDQNKSNIFKDLFGAARGIRTPDPIITNDVLYRLSYCGFSMG
jgi:hypothetical protein